MAESQQHCEQLRHGFERDTDVNAIVIGGDMNGRLALNGDHTANDAGAELRDFAESNSFTIANELPLAKGNWSFTVAERRTKKLRRSTIDYALVSAEHAPAVAAFQIHDDSGIGSDHKPVTIELAITCTAAATHRPRTDATDAAVRPDARPNRRAMRPDNDELRGALDDAFARWLVTARPDEWHDAHAVERGVRSIATQLDACARAAAQAPTAARTPAPHARRKPSHNRTFGTPAAERVRRTAVAIANAAARLNALHRAPEPDRTAIDACRRQLQSLHRKRQATARRELERQRAADEREMFRTGDDRAAWDKLQTALALSRRRRARSVTKAVGALTDANGRLVTDPKRIADVFRQHFARESAADERDTSAADTDLLRRTAANATAHTSLCAPTDDRTIRRHIRKMKAGKAAGPDGTYPELLKIDSAETTRAITAVTNAVLRTRHWPSLWGVGNVVPLPKAGGNRQNAADYRGITLLSVVSKVVESVMNERLMLWLESTGGSTNSSAPLKRPPPQRVAAQPYGPLPPRHRLRRTTPCSSRIVVRAVREYARAGESATHSHSRHRPQR